MGSEAHAGELRETRFYVVGVAVLARVEKVVVQFHAVGGLQDCVLHMNQILLFEDCKACLVDAQVLGGRIWVGVCVVVDRSCCHCIGTHGGSLHSDEAHKCTVELEDYPLETWVPECMRRVAARRIVCLVGALGLWGAGSKNDFAV